jgi:hypothetical protein
LVAQNPRGVIVSPDPFFRSEAQAFKDAMTTDAGLNVPICYPFKDFPLRTSPADQLLAGGAVLSTTSTVQTEILQTAYGQLGAQAGAILDTPAQLIKSKRWESGAWSEV